MKKKLQVFVSSTYTDLISERQAAVQAILNAGHIPAGMELFKAGNESQLDTIKKWIQDSDVFLLILGGRYGTIEPLSKMSYIHVEYEYALSLQIPVFALVLSKSFLHNKASTNLGDTVFENENKDAYSNFKKHVMTKMVREVEDEKDIKLEVFATLNVFMEQYTLLGWIKGADIQSAESADKELLRLSKENAELLKENRELGEKINKISEESTDLFGSYSYAKLKDILSKHMIEVPSDIMDIGESRMVSALILYIKYYNVYATGISNYKGMSVTPKFVFYKLSPILLSYELLERSKMPDSITRIQASRIGLRFYGRLSQDINENP